jgi:hypothetical protein
MPCSIQSSLGFPAGRRSVDLISRDLERILLGMSLHRSNCAAAKFVSANVLDVNGYRFFANPLKLKQQFSLLAAIVDLIVPPIVEIGLVSKKG